MVIKKNKIFALTAALILLVGVAKLDACFFPSSTPEQNIKVESCFASDFINKTAKKIQKKPFKTIIKPMLYAWKCVKIPYFIVPIALFFINPKKAVQRMKKFRYFSAESLVNLSRPKLLTIPKVCEPSSVFYNPELCEQSIDKPGSCGNPLYNPELHGNAFHNGFSIYNEILKIPEQKLIDYEQDGAQRILRNEKDWNPIFNRYEATPGIVSDIYKHEKFLFLYLFLL